MAVAEDQIIVGGRTVRRGERAAIRLPVTVGLNGAELALWVHVVQGTEAGPVMALLSGLHGGEWFSIETMRRLVRGVEPEHLRGTLLVVPVANPPALALQTRNIPDESDSPDLNRSFGGEQTWLADQLARALAEHLLAHADAVVDFHCGLWGATMGSVTCGRDFDDPSVSERAFGMARAFGLPHVRRGDLATRLPGPKSAVGYAGQVLRIPGIIAEIGGAGFDPQLEQEWLDANVRGVRGVMQHLGILPGEPTQPERVLVFGRVRRVNPTSGGMVEPVFPPEELMRREVQAGELLGRVWSPYTLEVIEELRAPVRGLIDMVPRPYPVRPGDWAYLVVDLEDPDARWVGPGEMP